MRTLLSPEFHLNIAGVVSLFFTVTVLPIAVNLVKKLHGFGMEGHNVWKGHETICAPQTGDAIPFTTIITDSRPMAIARPFSVQPSCQHFSFRITYLSEYPLCVLISAQTSMLSGGLQRINFMCVELPQWSTARVPKCIVLSSKVYVLSRKGYHALGAWAHNKGTMLFLAGNMFVNTQMYFLSIKQGLFPFWTLSSKDPEGDNLCNLNGIMNLTQKG